MQLRPYQARAIDRDLPAAFRRSRRVVYVAPTGSGKSTSVAELVRRALAKGRRVLFLVHRYRLVQQLEAVLPNSDNVLVLMVQSACRRLDQIQAFAPNLIVTDEAHRGTAASYVAVYDAVPEAWSLGLTATPCRTDGRGLGEVYDEIVTGPDTRELIDAGYLADYRLYRPADPPRFKGVAKRGGDYAAGAMADAVDRPTITGDSIAEYRRLCPGGRALFFAANVQHAENVAAAFQSAGIPAAHVSGRMSEDEQNARLDALERGEIRLLANVALVEEGVDVPALDAVIWGKRTSSVRVWRQGNGRALRPAPGKTAVIIDQCDNAMGEGLGLPCEPMEWSLDGTHKPAGGGASGLRWCQSCFAASPAGSTVCVACGTPFKAQTRAGPDHVDGELVEVDPRAEAQLRDELAALPEHEAKLWAKDGEGMRRIGKARKWSPGKVIRLTAWRWDMSLHDAAKAAGYNPWIIKKLGMA